LTPEETSATDWRVAHRPQVLGASAQALFTPVETAGGQTSKRAALMASTVPAR
jgi:hypothetical protein